MQSAITRHGAATTTHHATQQQLLAAPHAGPALQQKFRPFCAAAHGRPIKGALPRTVLGPSLRRSSGGRAAAQPVICQAAPAEKMTVAITGVHRGPGSCTLRPDPMWQRVVATHTYSLTRRFRWKRSIRDPASALRFGTLDKCLLKCLLVVQVCSTRSSDDRSWAVCGAGATGLVGSRLAAKLAAQGHKVRVLTRNVAAAKSKLTYPGLDFFGPADWAKGIAGATGVVNLAGEPIATR